MVELACLENKCASNGTEGSNPSLSAKSIDTACKLEYTVGMKSMQYTIRSIPVSVDRALRRQAHKSGKSLNEVVIETLQKGAGVAQDATFDDLDWFIGSNTLDSSFDDALEWLNSVPKDLE